MQGIKSSRNVKKDLSEKQCFQEPSKDKSTLLAFFKMDFEEQGVWAGTLVLEEKHSSWKCESLTQGRFKMVLVCEVLPESSMGPQKLEGTLCLRGMAATISQQYRCMLCVHAVLLSILLLSLWLRTTIACSNSYFLGYYGMHGH